MNETQTTSESLKVFQLAKELGVDSFTLLDKLRDLKIEVKNHMSELGPEQTQLVRETLGAKKTAAKKPASKSGSKSSAKSTSAKTTSAPKRRSSAVAAQTDSSETQSALAATSSTVIRRRQINETQSEIVRTVTTTEKSVPATPASSPVQVAPPDHMEEVRPDVEVVVVQEQVLVETPATEIVEPPAEDAVSVEALPVLPALGAASASSTPPVAAAVPPVQSTTTETTIATGTTTATAITTTTTTTTVAGARVIQKRSVLNVVAPSGAPKSLMRTVTPAPPKVVVAASKAGQSTSPETAKGGRIIKMTKEKLDKLAEEEAAKKKSIAREQLKPEDVRFADYRKKEMVFLPKRKKIPVGKELKRTQITTPSAQKRIVTMGEAITVGELANQMGLKAGEVIKKFMSLGSMVTINQAIDYDTALLVAQEFKYEIRNTAFKEVSVLDSGTDSKENLIPRPPVVTIMGHVDHGKTTLLDSIRNANVAAGEAGGITQHIGAYTIDKKATDGTTKQITFIDTPGHEAFTLMRARGANVTDIVVLVVAADDGVMPQTREALSHAKAAGVPIVVAVNKIDKPGANPEKIRQALAELNLLSEDWGGDTMFVPVSALKKEGIDALLDAILLNAEVLDLKANTEARASGIVLESRLEKGRGPVATILVKRGTLSLGDQAVSGVSFGRIKAMTNHEGASISTLGPGMAAEVLGLSHVPQAGEPFNAVDNEADARELVLHRTNKEKARAQVPVGVAAKPTLEALFAKIKSGESKELKIILKADVYGSVEAVRDSLTKLTNDQVRVQVIHAASGGITESDVLLASASQAIIIGFNVRPETKARRVAEAEHVEVKCYNIIYEVVDEVKKAMTGMLDKKKVEHYLGRAEVRQVFTVPSIGVVAGCFVVDGKVQRGAMVRLLRDSRVIYEGKMSSLRRFKDDAREVAQGYECGIGIEKFNDVKLGDLIEAFEIQWMTPELNAPKAAELGAPKTNESKGSEHGRNPSSAH